MSAELWAIEPMRFSGVMWCLQRLNGGQPVASQARAGSCQSQAVRRSEGPSIIAVISMEGVTTKQGLWPFAGAATVEIRNEIRQAAADPAVDGILLVIDSPGGTVAGTADLAAEVRAANAKKPVFAFVDDLAASAAYWVASQARRVYANNATAIVGSIGTLMGLYDQSKQYSKQGVRPVLVSTGPHKGAGFPGSAVTADQKAHFEEIVNQTQQSFTAAVAAGRGFSKKEINKLADGRVYLAAEALSLRLIDGVQSLDATISELANFTTNARSSETMATHYERPTKPAKTRAASPAADPIEAFWEAVDRKVKTGLPKAAAVSAVVAERPKLHERFLQANQQGKQTKRVTAKAADLPEIEAEWNAAIKAKMRSGMNRHRATAAVVEENPELHQAYLAAYNAAHQRRF